VERRPPGQPDEKRDEAKCTQAKGKVVPGGGIEVGPDLRPGLAHEPPGHCNVKRCHEGCEAYAQQEMTDRRDKTNAGYREPADGKGEQCPCQCAELDRTFLPNARSDDDSSKNAMKRLCAGEQNAESSDAKQRVRSQVALFFYGLP